MKAILTSLISDIVIVVSELKLVVDRDVDNASGDRWLASRLVHRLESELSRSILKNDTCLPDVDL